jgi:hypothetical protein
MLHRAVVKRAYVELRERTPYLKRLAFWTITEQGTDQSELFHLTGSKAEDIDVVVTVDEVDVEKQRRALDCYVTYQATIDAHQDGSADASRTCCRDPKGRALACSLDWVYNPT